MPVFLEVGPGKTLGSLAKQNPAVNAQSVVSSLRHPEEKVDDRAFFQTVLGRLWALGVPLAAEALWPGETRRRLPLPTYAFQGQRYWIEPGKAQAAREAPRAAGEDRGPRPLVLGAGLAPAGPGRGRGDRRRHAGGAGRPLVAGVPGRRPASATSWWPSCARSDQEVITVQPGDAFYKVSDREYWLIARAGRRGLPGADPRRPGQRPGAQPHRRTCGC